MERNVMWAPWSEQGLEHLHLLWNDDRMTADSIIIGFVDRTPFRLWYEMVCDANWQVKELGLIFLSSKGKSIKIRTDGEGRWSTSAGEPLSSLDGCIDVDISVTPFTNTLPIRRLGLSAGQSAELLVAYVAVPELELKPMRQRYTCIELNAQAGLYRYESLASGFSAELPIDADGLVLDYPGIWRRVWASPEIES